MQETIGNSILCLHVHVEFWIHSKCYRVSDDLPVDLREESEAEDRDGDADHGDADQQGDAFSDDYN